MNTYYQNVALIFDEEKNFFFDFQRESMGILS